MKPADETNAFRVDYPDQRVLEIHHQFCGLFYSHYQPYNHFMLMLFLFLWTSHSNTPLYVITDAVRKIIEQIQLDMTGLKATMFELKT